jgi:hypothetical protein
MSYRGEDLDIRVPAGRTAGSYPASADSEGANGRRGGTVVSASGTLWVDDELLACCNNAFDLALAHGAAEVRLEHLVHALTRSDSAARLLERHGVSEARLRRESAALIVNDNSIAMIGDGGTPRRSVELEETLRRATDIAQRRGVVAGVEDALIAILMSNRDSAAVNLLKRLAPDWQPRDLPALRPEPAEANALLLSDGRLGQIEGALRGIHAEIAGDRKLLTDIVRDLQREISLQRGDGAALSTALTDRLAEIERQLAARTEPLRATPQISEKLQSIEKAVQSGMGEGARNWAALDKRLKELEASVKQTTDGASLVEPLLQRLTVLEQVMAERSSDTLRSWNALADRVQSLEKLYQAGSSEAAKQWNALSEGNAVLKSIEQRVSTATIDGGALSERLELIERTIRSGLTDAARANALLADRVGIIERVVGSRNDTEPVLLLDERLRALEHSLDGRARETGGRWNELVDRLRTIEARISSVVEAPAGSLPSPEALASPIVTVLTSVDNAATARDARQARAISEIGGRIAALEHVVQANAAAVAAAARVSDRNADELHEGFVRLSENQHTLASAIGDWRDESTTEFRMIANGFDRLKVIEERLDHLTRYFTSNAMRVEPAPIPHSIAQPPVYRPPANASALRSGGETAAGGGTGAALRSFWRWLFGTDDVRQANRDARIKWQQMRDEVRAASQRLRKR